MEQLILTVSYSAIMVITVLGATATAIFIFQYKKMKEEAQKELMLLERNVSSIAGLYMADPRNFAKIIAARKKVKPQRASLPIWRGPELLWKECECEGDKENGIGN